MIVFFVDDFVNLAIMKEMTERPIIRLLYAATIALQLAICISSSLIYYFREDWIPEQFTVKLFDKTRPDVQVGRDDCLWWLFQLPLIAVGSTLLIFIVLRFNRNPKTREALIANPLVLPGLLMMLSVTFAGLQVFHLARMFIL